MSANTLISLLDGVKRTGLGRWLAKCPSHDDRTPSLSIRELEDGRVLVHCFAGCDVHEVVHAVGLQIDDLFPPRAIEDGRGKPERRPFSAADALRALAGEAAFLYLCAKQVATGEPLCASDQARLLLACSRIADAARAAGVSV